MSFFTNVHRRIASFSFVFPNVIINARKIDIFAYSRIYVVVTLLLLRFERTIRIQRSFTHLNLLLNLLNRNRGACACETALLHHFFQFSSNFKARIGERKKNERASDTRARTTSSFNALLMPACLPLKFLKTSSGVRGLNSLIGLSTNLYKFVLLNNLLKI